ASDTGARPAAAATASPTGCFSTGMLSPVTDDSSMALTPETTIPSALNREFGSTTTVSPARSSSTSISSTRSRPRRTSAVRGASPLRPAHRVLLERVPEAEQEQQHRALGPFADRRRTSGRDQHQEVDLEAAAANGVDGRADGEEATQHVGGQKQRGRHPPRG